MPFTPGDTVLIRARVVNVYHAEREEAYQTYGLQLGDGQSLMTNVKNLEKVEVPVENPEPKKPASALTQKPPRPQHKAIVGPREGG